MSELIKVLGRHVRIDIQTGSQWRDLGSGVG